MFYLLTPRIEDVAIFEDNGRVNPLKSPSSFEVTKVIFLDLVESNYFTTTSSKNVKPFQTHHHRAYGQSQKTEPTDMDEYIQFKFIQWDFFVL